MTRATPRPAKGTADKLRRARVRLHKVQEASVGTTTEGGGMTRAYPVTLGLTATEILLMLQHGPMTRRQVEISLSTFTAGMHLPRLRERGLVIVSDIRPRGRHVYSLTQRGAKMAREMAKP